jgi:hypothetical protein
MVSLTGAIMKTEIEKSGGRALVADLKPASTASKEIYLDRYRRGDSVAEALEKAGMTRAQLKRALADDNRLRSGDRR